VKFAENIKEVAWFINFNFD